MAKFAFVGGATSRSRGACANCRKWKKKCDEAKPVCGLCTARGSQCEWTRITKKTERLARERLAGALAHQVDSLAEVLADQLVLVELEVRLEPTRKPGNHEDRTCKGSHVDDARSSHNTSKAAGSTSSSGTSAKDEVDLVAKAAIGSQLLSLEKLFEGQKPYFLPNLSETTNGFALSTPINSFLRSSLREKLSGVDKAHLILFDPFSIQLVVSSHGYTIPVGSKQERTYLQNYIAIANEMSVDGARNSNFNGYLSVYLPMAMSSNLVLKSLISWGGMAMGDYHETTSKQQYLKDTLALLEEQFSRPSLSREQYSFLQASYMILADAHITSGDIKRWPPLLERAISITKRMGLYDDVVHESQVFQISANERWLALNLLHHDMLSSQACTRGTLFPPETLLKFSESAPDPLHGCIRPFLVLLCETIKLSIEAKEKYRLLENSLKINNYKTTAHMNRIHEMALDLDARMTNSKPKFEVLNCIPKEYLEQHLSLYELFQFSSQIFLRIAVRKYGTNVPEIQILLYKVINMLIFLINCEVKNAIKFPFLIAGISCVYDCDKMKLMSLLEEYEKNIAHASVSRIKQVIKDVWKLNPDGLLCLDWNNIVNGLGWELCLI